MPKNVIIVYADDLGYGDVTRYVNSVIPSHNIDKFTNNGLHFTDATVQHQLVAHLGIHYSQNRWALGDSLVAIFRKNFIYLI